MKLRMRSRTAVSSGSNQSSPRNGCAVVVAILSSMAWSPGGWQPPFGSRSNQEITPPPNSHHPCDSTASVILGVCQGPVAGFGTVWWDKNTALLSGLPGLSTVNLGADGQTPDPFWTTNHPAKALG